MAKRKGGKASGEGALTIDKARSNPSVTEDANELVLPELSLEGLTAKIEQKLRNQGSGTSKAKSEEKWKKKKVDTVKDVNKRTAVNPRVDLKPGGVKGKKRDRNGDVLPASGSPGHGLSLGDRKGDGDLLRREIYAVGGNSDDYDLLAGVESDSEMEDTKAGQKIVVRSGVDEDNLRKDIEKLMKWADKSVGNVATADKASKRKENFQSVTTVQESQFNVVRNKSRREGNQRGNIAQITRDKTTFEPTISPRSDWYSAPLPSIPLGEKPVAVLRRDVVEGIREHAFTLLEAENKAYLVTQQASSSASYKFYTTIASSGTLSDKISALTLAVQESPLHNTKALESLVGLAKKRSRAQAVEVLRSLKDLFAQGAVLPKHRKLRSFASQPGLAAAFGAGTFQWVRGGPLPAGIEDSHLIVWAFEDLLKEQYFEVLKVLEIWCNDEIEFSRSRAVSYVYELLKEKPEQESNLLRLLVNKLGDPNKKIASRASYLLLQLEQAHPLMKSTIVSAIESELLFRPGQTLHAKYYAIITLNQTVLSESEEKLALQLLDIYFSLFMVLLKQQEHCNEPRNTTRRTPKPRKGRKKDVKEQQKVGHGSQDDEMTDKLIAGILSGVNRAYPYARSDADRVIGHVNTLFRITHSSNFNTSVQALMLIQQLSQSHQVSNDRFYRTLYESLFDPRISASSKQTLYLNILYKALKSDFDVKRVKAFVKRMVQALSVHQPSFICGVFYLIRELEKTFSSLTALVDDPERQEDDEEEIFRDIPEGNDNTELAAQSPDNPADEQQTKSRVAKYDFRKRAPQHSNADKSCLWELLPYLCHFHPSVSTAATQLLNHEDMPGKPDLSLHSLSHFLDRFVYRNPKISPSLRGSSLMQPLAGGDTSGLLVAPGGRGNVQEAVNSEVFWQKKSEEVSAEYSFFHAYFNRVGKDKARAQKRMKKRAAAPEDEREESDAESDIWKALVESRPEIEGDFSSDDDVDMEGFESAMEENDQQDEDVDFGEQELLTRDSGEHEPEDWECKNVPNGDDESDFDMDLSDPEALRGSDDEVPSDLDLEITKSTGPVPTASKSSSKSLGQRKKQKVKHLPTFASVEDYEALLAKEDSD